MPPSLNSFIHSFVIKVANWLNIESSSLFLTSFRYQDVSPWCPLLPSLHSFILHSSHLNNFDERISKKWHKICHSAETVLSNGTVTIAAFAPISSSIHYFIHSEPSILDENRFLIVCTFKNKLHRDSSVGFVIHSLWQAIAWELPYGSSDAWREKSPLFFWQPAHFSLFFMHLFLLP